MKVQKQSVLINVNIKKCINKRINYIFKKNYINNIVTFNYKRKKRTNVLSCGHNCCWFSKNISNPKACILVFEKHEYWKHIFLSNV